MFKSKIVYYYDEEFGTFNYSTSHPMKPIRVAITDDLVHHYGLHKYMDSIVNFIFIITLRTKIMYKNILKE